MPKSLLLALFSIALSFSLCACGGGGSSEASTGSQSNSSPASSTSSQSSASSSGTSSPGAASSAASSSSASSASKSAKRGIAYNLSSTADMSALSAGVSWWYNWTLQPDSSLPENARTTYGMDFYPMLWNGDFDDAEVITFLEAHPEIHYMLVMNEPNLVDQANLTPTEAAAIWPRYEAISEQTGVKIVGPAMNWGTMSGYSDPVVWLDDFYAAYQAANAGEDPQIDYLAFHWYDYGLADQLDRLAKYGKPFWITEFANWHDTSDGAEIDTLAKQKAQMADMVATCESRSDVFRYAWFTGRLTDDPHYTSLLDADGTLTELGQYYLSLPY